MKRHKPIRSRSERRERFEAELNGVTDALYARAGDLCEICQEAEIHPLCVACRGHSWDLWCDLCVDRMFAGLLGHRHHRLRRGQGGGNDLSNLMALCDFCHKHVHAYPTLSFERGWLLHSSPACA